MALLRYLHVVPRRRTWLELSTHWSGSEFEAAVQGLRTAANYSRYEGGFGRSIPPTAYRAAKLNPEYSFICTCRTVTMLAQSWQSLIHLLVHGVCGYQVLILHSRDMISQMFLVFAFV